jgi:hypothetical protein
MYYLQSITGLTPRAIIAWGNHINGARAIAEDGGRSIIEDETSKRIIAHLSESVVCTITRY